MSEPPGSLGVPFLGEAREFFADPFAFALSRTRRYGTVWKTRILGDTVVFFAGPQAFSFFVHPEHFVRQGAMLRPLERLLHPEAVPFLDGERHVRRKRLLLAAFTDDALDGYLPGLFTIFERFSSRWVGQGEQRLADELPQLVSDVVGYLFAADDPETSNAARAADLADCAAFLRTAPLPLNLPFTAYGKALRARDRLRTHISGQLAATDDPGTVLGALTTASGPDGERLAPDELEIALVHFCLAAHPQLVAVLAWLLVVLGEHPGLARRLRDEADSVLGEGAPTLNEVRGLATARAVSREVLRAYPITASTLFGVATQGLEFDGYTIRAGWKGAGAIWPTLQDDSTFRDPAAFHADRLSDEAFAALPPDAFVPQGGGPHRCVAETLVQTMMPAFLGWFAKHHELTYPAQDASPGAGGLGPLPRSGVRAAVEPRL